MGLESNPWMEERSVQAGTGQSGSHLYQNAPLFSSTGVIEDPSLWDAPSCHQPAYNSSTKSTESTSTSPWKTSSTGARTVGICRPITRDDPSVQTAQPHESVVCPSSRRQQPLIVSLPPLTPVTHDCSTAIYDVPPCHQEQVSQYSQVSQPSHEHIQVLLQTYKHLDQCLFFYKNLKMQEAKKRLSAHKPGAFLLRTSSDPNFILSLSVKTPRGTTSIRIAFRKGKFCLDSDPGLLTELPSFTNVFQLIDYYVQIASTFRKNSHVFLEATGRKDTPIVLKNPCLRETGSLKHLSRLAINTALRSQTHKLHGLPGASTSIIDYLMDYPYTV